METITTRKYHNQPVERDGFWFDSTAECRRYCELVILQQAGEITDLQVHPKFEIIPTFREARGHGRVREGKKHSATVYVADFSYYEKVHGPMEYIDRTILCVEDVKGGRGTITPEFRLKAKLLMLQRPDVDLRIVEA